MGRASLAVVAPVFEDGDVAARFCRDVREALGQDLTMVLVDDAARILALKDSANALPNGLERLIVAAGCEAVLVLAILVAAVRRPGAASHPIDQG